MEQQMQSSEKTFVVDDIDDDTEMQEEMNEILPETIEITTQSFQKQDGKLTKLYNRINNDMLNAMQSREGERMNKFLKTLQDSHMDWENVTDHLGRNVLHYAVEYNNIPLVKTLLSCGVNQCPGRLWCYTTVYCSFK